MCAPFVRRCAFVCIVCVLERLLPWKYQICGVGEDGGAPENRGAGDEKAGGRNYERMESGRSNSRESRNNSEYFNIKNKTKKRGQEKRGGSRECKLPEAGRVACE